jgi:predicted nuclease of restriction endonuclease-like RecB superfamily
MLTREHLSYRIRTGTIRPAFVAPSDPELLLLSERLITTSAELVGIERRAVEAALRAHANAHQKPKVARGLAKLLLDRMDFGEAGEEAEELRRVTFPAASAILRALPPGASFAEYEGALAGSMDLGEVRERLFADLAEHRPLLSFRAIDPESLLDRYNLALAQGLLLYTDQITITVDRPDVLEIRRVLRWLKFCRLVAYLERFEDRWVLAVEGPGAILSMQKKYGLQLAGFLGAVPLLSRWRLAAAVRLPRKVPCALELTQEDPLVSPFAGAPGHLPEEIRAFVEAFQDEAWSIDTTPEIRPVGVRDLAVPDFVLRHRETGGTVAVELFHRWHRSLLGRRLEALASKPDPTLVLGVDRSLLDEELKEQIAGSDRIFVFNAFPSKRALEKVLIRMQ